MNCRKCLCFLPPAGYDTENGVHWDCQLYLAFEVGRLQAELKDRDAVISRLQYAVRAMDRRKKSPGCNRGNQPITAPLWSREAQDARNTKQEAGQ